MCVLGAIYLEKPIIEPLTDFVFLGDRPQDNGTRQYKLGVLFASLRLATERLEQYYIKLDDSSKDKRFFPYPHQYTDGDNNLVNFTYLYHGVTEDRSKLIWKAKTEDDRLIVAKFTTEYNADAHRLLANHGLAPRLLSDEDLTGGWRMIIMEFIGGDILFEHIRNPVGDYIHVFADVKRAVDLLHSENIVFADLRTPNVLVKKVNGQLHGMLIDFDWCGEHKRDRYPWTMNTELLWPEGAIPGQPLDKSHDHFWIKWLSKNLRLR
jgi:tRNA A-37 threonylcarbamoyl transferase component Bud32